MVGKFLEFFPDLTLKDVKREFDYGQKLAIYSRDKGTCQGLNCQKSVKFSEAEFHHIKPWHEGGPTTVHNGLLLCHKCHAKQPKSLKATISGAPITNTARRG
jgi:predicted restriction endonuclease